MDDARKRVQEELNQLCSLLSNASANLHSEVSARQTEVEAYQIKLKTTNFVLAALLLYRPARTVAWVPRVFFYLFLVVGIFGPFLPETDHKNDVAGTVGCVIIAAAFWGLARFVERPALPPSEGLPPTSAPRHHRRLAGAGSDALLHKPHRAGYPEPRDFRRPAPHHDRRRHRGASRLSLQKPPRGLHPRASGAPSRSSGTCATPR